MARKRPTIAMPARDAQDFLARSGEVVVAVCDHQGWPVGSIAAAAVRESTVTVRLASDDPVAVVAAAGSPICCATDESPSYYEIRGVVAHGDVVGHSTQARGVSTVTFRVDRLVSFDFGRLRPKTDTDIGPPQV